MSSVRQRLLERMEQYKPQAKIILPLDSLLGEAYELLFEDNKLLTAEVQRLQAKLTELVMELQVYRPMTLEKKYLEEFSRKRRA